jgi:hypothetical protein
VQRQLAARFDGEVAGGAVADSFFVISGSGRRWSSGGWGDRSIDHEAAAAPAEISNGVIDNRSENLQH